MDAGELRDRITIERSHSIQNTRGGAVPVWTPQRTVWGGIRHLSGRQLQLAQASTISSTATHQIKIRYTEGIDPNTRLTVTMPNGFKRKFRINDINDVDNRHIELLLTVTEVMA